MSDDDDRVANSPELRDVTPCNNGGTDQVVVVDLFCGAGGFSAGVHMSGCDVVLAIDSNPNMLSLHHHNFPSARHVLTELGHEAVEVFGQRLLDFVGGRPWHLHGSPPCQSFSIAYRTGGHQTGGDDRTNLTFWYLELVNWLRGQPNAPRSWSMEQVPTALKSIRASVPWIEAVTVRVAHGWEFGAPTLRKRAFVGEGWTLKAPFRKSVKRPCGGDDTAPTLPTPAHPELGLPATLQEFGLEPSKVAVRGTRNYDYTGYSRRFIGPLPQGKVRNHKVDSTLGEGLRPFSVPCYAMVASTTLTLWTHDGPACRWDGTVKWRERRKLTPDEAKRIQGFPDSYQIQEVQETSLVAYGSIEAAEPMPVQKHKLSEGHKTRAIGNSVIPLISAHMFGYSLPPPTVHT